MLDPDKHARDLLDPLLNSLVPNRTNGESREQFIKQDLTVRLKAACKHLTKLEFDVLVTDMTREQLRGETVPGRRIRHS
jgi:hypothetical protein